MQRKNDLLMPKNSNIRRTSGSTLTSGKLFFTKKVPSRQARGFAMIMSVIVMIVVATIIMFTLSQTAQTIKKTADVYLYEQAELHTKGAIEYTLYKIAQQGCVNNNIVFTLDTIYDVNVSTRYVYTEANTNILNPLINCNEFIGANTIPPSAYIQTEEQNGSVLMDISISVSSANTGSDPIRYTRRTIQKL